MGSRRASVWAPNTASKGRHWTSHCPLTFPGDPVLLSWPVPMTCLFKIKSNHSYPIRGQHVIVEVTYETSPSASALQWLTPEQTAGKEKPYLFSQCQVSCGSLTSGRRSLHVLPAWVLSPTVHRHAGRLTGANVNHCLSLLVLPRCALPRCALGQLIAHENISAGKKFHFPFLLFDF